MSFWNFLVGNKAKTTNIPTQTPQGMQLLNQLMSQGKQNTDFGGIENMYMKKFFSDIIPGLEDQWASVGDERNSSALQSARYGAGSDLMAKLAALRSQYGLQQSQLGLQPQFQTMYQPATQGFLQQMAGPLGKIGLGMATGGMAGAGMFGRGMMDQWRNPGSQTGFNYAQAMPWSIMGGGFR